MAASQLAATLQSDLEAAQQELADRLLSCATAIEKAASLQAELETVKGTVCCLEGQLEAALQGVAAEHGHQAAMQSPSCILQVKLKGVSVLAVCV